MINHDTPVGQSCPDNWQMMNLELKGKRNAEEFAEISIYQDQDSNIAEAVVRNQKVRQRQVAQKHSCGYQIRRDIQGMDLDAGPYNFHIQAQDMCHTVTGVKSIELEVLDESSEWVA